MAWFSSKVKVTFIDDATGESFCTSQLPPNDLPESFELDTTLHLGDGDWSVVDAQPKTRKEYARTRTLTLRLRRVEMVELSKILYSLPSICDLVPPVSNQPLSNSELVLAEDDWRQFELVSNELASEVDDQIANIRRIHETAASEYGWREIHVRSNPELPLISTLALDDLRRSLNLSAATTGVTYRGAQSPIADGYAFTIDDGLSIYGVAPNGCVQVLAFTQQSKSAPSTMSVERLKSFARQLNLDLVNWCRCIRVAPDDPLFGSLLSNDAG